MHHRKLAIAFLLFLAIALGLQAVHGAYRAELSQTSDEAAHYVTGLMVRDYLLSGFHQAPLPFARDYYQHYPKVALGHWPPVFYGVQALWTVVFGAGRFPILFLMAVLCALNAAVLYQAVRAAGSRGEAVAAGCLFLVLPLTVTHASEVMAELLVSLLVLCAALAWGEYLDHPGVRPALWFGAWSSVAILTKGTGLVLALLPAVSMAAGFRWRLLRRWDVWLPAAMVAATCAPWYLWVPDARHESVAVYGGVNAHWWMVVGTRFGWFRAVGPWLLPLVLVGLIGCAGQRKAGGRFLAAGSLLVSLAVFRSVIGAARPDRTLTIAVPALLLLAASGWQWMASRVKPAWIRTALAVAVTAGTVAWSWPRVPPIERLGYIELVRLLRDRPEWQHPVMLVVADARGEGALISEVAMTGNRPSHTIVRGSKLLVEENWMGTTSRPLFTTPDQVAGALDRAGVGIVVLDAVEGTAGYYRLLEAAAAEHPDRWRPLFPVPLRTVEGASGRWFRVYELQGHLPALARWPTISTGTQVIAPPQPR